MNLNFSRKKFFLVGFLVILLVGIPLSLFLLQKQQETRSRAEKSTNIKFTPDSSLTSPLQHQVGDLIPLDIMVDPGKNLASYIKLEIQYDPDKLATAGATTFKPNVIAFPGVFEGPIYSVGKISLTLSVGIDSTKAIQVLTKAGTLTLKAIANTPPGNPTLVQYGSNTQVLSIGSTDQASENVLSSASPATIIIGGEAGPTMTPGQPGDTLAPIPTEIPSPAEPTSEVPTTEPTISEIPTEIPTVTPGQSGTPPQPPICNSLTADRETTGPAPFALTLTANGNAPSGTVSKVTFNYGDGSTSDVTTAGGIGTNQVNVQISHTYDNTGSFQAQALLTDSNNNVSDSASCKLDITVTASGSATAVPENPTATPATNVTMAPTGSSDVAVGIGIISAILILGGGLLFFIL